MFQRIPPPRTHPRFPSPYLAICGGAGTHASIWWDCALESLSSLLFSWAIPLKASKLNQVIPFGWSLASTPRCIFDMVLLLRTSSCFSWWRAMPWIVWMAFGQDQLQICIWRRCHSWLVVKEWSRVGWRWGFAFFLFSLIENSIGYGFNLN